MRVGVRARVRARVRVRVTHRRERGEQRDARVRVRVRVRVSTGGREGSSGMLAAEQGSAAAPGLQRLGRLVIQGVG